MDDATARMLLDAVRRSGDSLMAARFQLKQTLAPDELARWDSAVGEAMGTLFEQLVQPLCREHPAIVPKSLGGPADD